MHRYITRPPLIHQSITLSSIGERALDKGGANGRKPKRTARMKIVREGLSTEFHVHSMRFPQILDGAHRVSAGSPGRLSLTRQK